MLELSQILSGEIVEDCLQFHDEMRLVGAADDEDIEVGIDVAVGVVADPAVRAIIIF